MEIKQFRLSRGATINLGNYESARVDLEVIATGDLAKADQYVCTWIEHEVARIQEAAGLPPHPVERFTGGEE